jgi:hypothetical protein
LPGRKLPGSVERRYQGTLVYRDSLEFLRHCPLVADRGFMVADELTLYSLSSCLFLLTVDIVEDAVHGFQCPAPCFRYKIECPSQGEQAEDGEKRISPEACVLNQRRSDQAYDKVIQPV